MKKLISMALCLFMVTSTLTACSLEINGLKEAQAETPSAPTPTESEKPVVAITASLQDTPAPTENPADTQPPALPSPSASTDEMVEIMVPAIYYINSDLETVEAATAEYGIEVSQNANGDYTYKMTKFQQEQFISRQKEEFDGAVKQIFDSGAYPEIKDIRYNDDYSVVEFVCDRAAAEESQYFILVLLVIGRSAPLYQAYQGKGEDARSEIKLIDEATGEVYETYTAPDEFLFE